MFIVYIPGSPLPQGPKGLKGPTLGAGAYGRMRNEELRCRRIRGCDTGKTFESLRIIVGYVGVEFQRNLSTLIFHVASAQVGVAR